MRHPTLASAVAVTTTLVAGCAAIPPAEIPASSEHPRQVVVLDVDGTLTPHNLSVFEVRPGAAEAVQAYARKGYQIVYLTTRIPWFQSFLPSWLADHGFPLGVLHVAQSAEERNDAAGFKVAVLARYQAAGWRLAYAYGDSPSDFEAYAKAGVPRARVFALKRRLSETCAGDHYGQCLDGWVEHLHYVEREVQKAQ